MVWDLGVDQTQSPCKPKPLHVFRPRGLALGWGCCLRLEGHPVGAAHPWTTQNKQNKAPSLHFALPSSPLPFSTPGHPGKTSPTGLGNPLK